MKVQIFCSILVVAFAIVKGDVAPKNELEEHLINFFTKWRRGGVVTDLFSLPSLKSINIGGIKTAYDDSGINLDLTIGEMELTGLDNFELLKVDATQTKEFLNVSIEFAAPNLAVYSVNYQLSGRAYLIYPLRGSGAMTIKAQNNLLSLNFCVANVDSASSIVEGFSISYSVGKVVANLEKSVWPINDVLSKEGKKILESYHSNVIEAVTDYIIPPVNEYLSSVTIEDLINTVADISANSSVIENA